MSKRESRTFSGEFKLEVARRIEAGENVSALARGLVVGRAICPSVQPRRRWCTVTEFTTGPAWLAGKVALAPLVHSFCASARDRKKLYVGDPSVSCDFLERTFTMAVWRNENVTAARAAFTVHRRGRQCHLEVGILGRCLNTFRTTPNKMKIGSPSSVIVVSESGVSSHRT